MAATSSSASNGAPPPAVGEITSAAPSSSTTANNSKSGSSTSSGANAAHKKPAAASRHAAKKLTKESGDQNVVSEQQNGNGNHEAEDNKSHDGDVIETNDQPPQQRGPRKGGLNQELRERIKRTYQAKTVNLLVRYNKLGSQFADFANNVAFLSRCAKVSMVPKSHRVYNQEIRNTRVVVRILDQCCYKIMMADLDHNRRRKFQVRKNRERVEQRLKQILSPQDFEEIQKICEDNKEQHFTDVRERQRKEFEELMEEYKSNETTRRSESRRNMRTISTDRESETGDEQGYRDSKSAEPQPAAPSVIPKQPQMEQANDNGESSTRKQDAAQKTSKEASKAKTAPVGKQQDSAKTGSSSKK